jgi:hypothetical protein
VGKKKMSSAKTQPENDKDEMEKNIKSYDPNRIPVNVKLA